MNKDAIILVLGGLAVAVVLVITGIVALYSYVCQGSHPHNPFC